MSYTAVSNKAIPRVITVVTLSWVTATRRPSTLNKYDDAKPGALTVSNLEPQMTSLCRLEPNGSFSKRLCTWRYTQKGMKHDINTLYGTVTLCSFVRSTVLRNTQINQVVVVVVGARRSWKTTRFSITSSAENDVTSTTSSSWSVLDDSWKTTWNVTVQLRITLSSDTLFRSMKLSEKTHSCSSSSLSAEVSIFPSFQE